MKFKVERTSLHGKCEKPCEGVKLENYDYIERRTYTEKEFNRKFAQSEGLWRNKGINHTNYERGIKRTFTNAKNGWFIELNTLEELISFIEKVGEEVIIQKCCYNTEIFEIEIYDDCRE